MNIPLIVRHFQFRQQLDLEARRSVAVLFSLFRLSLSRFHYFLRRGKTSESRASPPTRFRCMFQLNVTKDDDPRRNADFRIFTREPGSGILRS